MSLAIGNAQGITCSLGMGAGGCLYLGLGGQVPRGEQWCNWCFTCCGVPYLIVFKRLFGVTLTLRKLLHDAVKGEGV